MGGVGEVDVGCCKGRLGVDEGAVLEDGEPGAVGVVAAVLVPEDGEERAVVGEGFDGEVGPVAWDEGLEFESVVEGGDDADQVGEDVVEVGGVEVVLAVVCRGAGPGVDGGVVGFGGEGDVAAVVVVGSGVDGHGALEELGCDDGAAVGSGDSGEGSQVDGCAERPALSLP